MQPSISSLTVPIHRRTDWSQLKSEGSLHFLNIGIAFALALGVALLTAWGIYAFMKKRVAPVAAAPPAPAWPPLAAG